MIDLNMVVDPRILDTYSMIKIKIGVLSSCYIVENIIAYAQV